MILSADIFTKLPLFVLIIVFCRFLWNYLRSPLRSFPGPVAARFTNIWRFQDVFKGRCDITHNRLHRKYGPAVRMGPNILSLSDPSLIREVFATKNPWAKSDMYPVNDVIISGHRIKNIFSHQDEKWHSKFIRPVKGLYSMSKVQDMEPALDVAINLLLDKLRERFVLPGRICEMSDYLNFLSWDSMSQVTFSQDLGILKAGSDYKGFLRQSNWSLDYFASICQIPSLDIVFDKNPIMRIGPPTFLWATLFGEEQVQKRHRDAPPPSGQPDFLEKILETKTKHPELVDDNTVVMYLLGNLLAGSDTTASTMSSAVYHVLKNPAVYGKLREELRAADLSLPARWKELKDLKYLNAVMRESMRIHPGVGLMIERVVPKGGFTLPDGRFVPEGTIVGMNPWVINKDEGVFGAHPESFIPERWLPNPGELDDNYQARFSKMKGTDFTFGAGTRACLGKYLSQLESYKVVATLFSTFDMELSNPDCEWRLVNSWFVRQRGVSVHIM